MYGLKTMCRDLMCTCFESQMTSMSTKGVSVFKRDYLMVYYVKVRIVFT